MKGYLLNAIIGDICGSPYEYWKNRIKYKPDNLRNEACRFTDDTVLTIAVAEAIMSDMDFASHIRKWALRYPDAGYGGMFVKWMYNPHPEPYFSYGNGSAMRVSPCAYYKCDMTKDDVSKIILAANSSAAVTHNHPSGLLGAVCVAMCIYYIRIARANGSDVNEMKSVLTDTLMDCYPNYELSKALDYRRSSYKFDSTCQGSVPQSIQCVLEAEDYEDAIKLAISMGGDSDTMACMAGSIAGVMWDVPEYLKDWAIPMLPDDMMKVINDFDEWVERKSLITSR